MTQPEKGPRVSDSRPEDAQPGGALCAIAMLGAMVAGIVWFCQTRIAPHLPELARQFSELGPGFTP